MIRISDQTKRACNVDRCFIIMNIYHLFKVSFTASNNSDFLIASLEGKRDE